MEKQKVIFFTGAGISLESGIATFQQQPGIRDKLCRKFANEHPEEYKEIIRQMVEACQIAEPNAAHKAIAETGFPVITMNIDKLHQKAGSKNVIELHGILPTQNELKQNDFALTYDKLILYKDTAPAYETAYKMVKALEYNNSHFIIVGTSFYTDISQRLLKIAKQRHAYLTIINNNSTKTKTCISYNYQQQLNRKSANHMSKPNRQIQTSIITKQSPIDGEPTTLTYAFFL